MGKKNVKCNAACEDRTHDLRMSYACCDYETDALPTELNPQEMKILAKGYYINNQND